MMPQKHAVRWFRVADVRASMRRRLTPPPEPWTMRPVKAQQCMRFEPRGQPAAFRRLWLAPYSLCNAAAKCP